MSAVAAARQRDVGLSSLAVMALPAAMSTAVADVPSPPTMTPTATPTTFFSELNLIYYYYLFIYDYVNCDVALSRCRHRRSIQAAATALPLSRCAPPPRFALPPLPRHCQASADVALLRSPARRWPVVIS
jgi:hypothetical protein